MRDPRNQCSSTDKLVILLMCILNICPVDFLHLIPRRARSMKTSDKALWEGNKLWSPWLRLRDSTLGLNDNGKSNPTIDERNSVFPEYLLTHWFHNHLLSFCLGDYPALQPCNCRGHTLNRARMKLVNAGMTCDNSQRLLSSPLCADLRKTPIRVGWHIQLPVPLVGCPFQVTERYLGSKITPQVAFAHMR